MPIACGEVVSGSTICSTNEGSLASMSSSDCGYTEGYGVWYVHTGNGLPVQITTCAPEFQYDTHLQVYTGSCGELTCYAWNDDYGYGPGGSIPELDELCTGSPMMGLQSGLVFDTEVGETYFIYVSGFADDTGGFDFTLSCTIPVFGCTDDTAINLSLIHI